MPYRPTGRPRGRPPFDGPLTPAEQRVLGVLRRGATNPEIAAELGVSIETVRSHISSMLSKLDLQDRSALAAWRPANEPRGGSRAMAGYRCDRSMALAVAGAGRIRVVLGALALVGAVWFTPQSGGQGSASTSLQPSPRETGTVRLTPFVRAQAAAKPAAAPDDFRPSASTPTSTPTVRHARPCHAGDLIVLAGEPNAATQNFITWFTILNTSSSRCMLAGRPQVRLFDAQGRRIRFSRGNARQTPAAAVVIEPTAVLAPRRRGAGFEVFTGAGVLCSFSRPTARLQVVLPRHHGVLLVTGPNLPSPYDGIMGLSAYQPHTER